LTRDDSAAVLLTSILGTYAVLLLISKRYRRDSVKMFRFEKSRWRVAIENPMAIFGQVLSLIMTVIFFEIANVSTVKLGSSRTFAAHGPNDP
jgi:uncharacterized membrane protein